MKTTIISFALLMGSIFSSNAQDSTKNSASIAVATPSIQGLYITPTLATKLVNLELVKINQYKVYDEYDMAEVLKTNPAFQSNCFGINCLTSLGNALKVDYIMSGSFDQLGNKIIVSIKIINVKTSSIYKTALREFDNQEAELQRMVEITLKEMHGLSNQKEIVDRLSFKNEVITSNNLGKINNSGPRLGYAVLNGSLAEFATRSEEQGGMEINPFVSMIGYQFEKQYVGTENFSALFETVVNISGLEQSSFIPSISLMNGFRFGKSGWEFAFGPSFGLQKTSKGFFDDNNLYGKGNGYYWTQNEYIQYNYDLQNQGLPYQATPAYSYATTLDSRGSISLSTRWVMGFGRTFRAGSLNIPVNIFYSSVKRGNMVGVSVGFNVLKKKENINKK